MVGENRRLLTLYLGADKPSDTFFESPHRLVVGVPTVLTIRQLPPNSQLALSPVASRRLFAPGSEAMGMDELGRTGKSFAVLPGWTRMDFAEHVQNETWRTGNTRVRFDKN